MAGVVKGYQMAAHSGIPCGIHERSAGRRLISLEGGNRGMEQCGLRGARRYGDFNPNSWARFDPCIANEAQIALSGPVA